MGLSEGSWEQNDIPGRSDDLYAVVAAIKDHAQIDPHKVGVMGHSQGGWVVTHVTAQHHDIAFMINLMGPTTPVYQQVLYQWRQSFVCDGLSVIDVERKVAQKDRITKFAIRLGSIIQVGKLGFDSKVLPYDPTESIRDLEVPSLFLFGGLDALVPAKSNIVHLNSIFSESIPHYLSAVEIPKVNHFGYEVEDLCTALGPTAYNTASEPMVNAMNDWLDTIHI